MVSNGYAAYTHGAGGHCIHSRGAGSGAVLGTAYSDQKERIKHWGSSIAVEQIKRHRFSLKVKFGLIFIIYFLLTVSILEISFSYIHGLRETAQAINYTGNARTHSLKLAFLLNQYTAEEQGGAKDSLKNQIDKELTRFKEIQSGPRGGRKEPALALASVGLSLPNAERIQDTSTNFTRHIHIEDYQNQLKLKVLNVLGAASPGEGQRGLREVNSFVTLFVNDIDRTVKRLESESRSKFHRFLNLEFILTCLAGALTCFGTLFVLQSVLKPLEKMGYGMKSFSQGNWEERILMRTGDEIEELANGFNGMAAELAKKYSLLQTQNEQLRELNKLLSDSCIKDPLTGLCNYYYFQEILKAEHQNSKRYARPLSLLKVDIDYFKTVNDLWGHSFGDLVLKEFAELMRNQLGASDVTARVGGEEFAILMPSTEHDGAMETAKRLRKAIADHNFLKEGMSCQLTVTIGLSSTSDPDTATEIDLLRHGDKALLEGKKRGGDSLISWTEICEELANTEGTEMQELVAHRERFLALERSYKRSYIETTLAFLKALETKDDYSARHSYLVADYSVKLAQALGLSNEETETIKNAAFLHDIGKIGIPDNILMKNGPLTEEESEVVRQHAHMALNILEKIRLLKKEIPIIYHHQEKWDGSGYPTGLKGKEIPIGARILAVADAYEAMTSDRPYRKGRSPEEAFNELKKGAGSQFEPELIPIFIKMMQEVLEKGNPAVEGSEGLSLEPSLP